jgi:GNAT superfamily N-acetyltransferase
METINIQKAEKKDCTTVTDLATELLKDFNERSGSNFTIDKAKLLEVAQQLIEKENYAAFIAYDKGKKPVGLITITGASAIYNLGDFGILTELYVDRTIRSQGVGQHLLYAAFEFAKAKGWKRIEVGAPIKEEWPRTFAFYIKNGFKEKSTKLRIEFP